MIFQESGEEFYDRLRRGTCLDVTDAEEAIYDRELTDILDILQEMLRESKSGRRMK